MKIDQPTHETVFAIHGSASTGKQWDGLANLLAPRKNFIAPSMPGYDQELDIGTDRRDFFSAALLSVVGRVDIVAHSFGCAIALYLANLFPDKVRSLVLYDPVALVGQEAAMPPDLLEFWTETKEQDAAKLMANFINFWMNENVWNSFDERRKDKLLRQHVTLKQDFHELENGNWAPETIAFEGQIYILRGARSPATIGHVTASLKQIYSDAIEVVIPNMGHMAPITNRDDIDELFMWFLMMANLQGELQRAA